MSARAWYTDAMKRRVTGWFLAALCAATAFLPHMNTFAEETPPSEEWVRVQTRLADLGYLLSSPDGSAPDAARVQEPAALFDAEAAFAPLLRTVPAAPAAAEGVKAEWSTVRSHLEEGARYFIACGGLSAQMIFRGGTSHAEMVPDTEWDAATVALFFPCEGSDDLPDSYARIAVTVRINGVDTQAWMQAAGESKTYCVYFCGSGSHVGALPDARASNEQP